MAVVNRARSTDAGQNTAVDAPQPSGLPRSAPAAGASRNRPSCIFVELAARLSRWSVTNNLLLVVQMLPIDDMTRVCTHWPYSRHLISTRTAEENVASPSFQSSGPGFPLTTLSSTPFVTPFDFHCKDGPYIYSHPHFRHIRPLRRWYVIFCPTAPVV